MNFHLMAHNSVLSIILVVVLLTRIQFNLYENIDTQELSPLSYNIIDDGGVYKLEKQLQKLF